MERNHPAGMRLGGQQPCRGMGETNLSLLGSGSTMIPEIEAVPHVPGLGGTKTSHKARHPIARSRPTGRIWGGNRVISAMLSVSRSRVSQSPPVDIAGVISFTVALRQVDKQPTQFRRRNLPLHESAAQHVYPVFAHPMIHLSQGNLSRERHGAVGFVPYSAGEIKALGRNLACKQSWLSRSVKRGRQPPSCWENDIGLTRISPPYHQARPLFRKLS